MTPVEGDPARGLNAAIAAVLRAERAAKGERITQDELAEAAGVPLVSLRRYLNGKRHINLAHLEAICDALGVDPRDVMADAARRSSVATQERLEDH